PGVQGPDRQRSPRRGREARRAGVDQRAHQNSEGRSDGASRRTDRRLHRPLRKANIMLGYEASSPYELEQQRIEERIRQLAGLKDAQTIDSPNYVYFQAQIDSLTAAWRQWDTNTHTLVDMDSKIAVAEAHVRHAVKAASTTPGGWLRAAGVLGSFGALCVAVSMLVTTTVMVPLAGGVLLVFGVGSMLAGVAARRGA